MNLERVISGKSLYKKKRKKCLNRERICILKCYKLAVVVYTLICSVSTPPLSPRQEAERGTEAASVSNAAEEYRDILGGMLYCILFIN